MSSTFLGITGLPRAGSTLLCQLLAHHPDIYCEGNSSPLCNTLLGIRRLISNDTFFLSQLDNQFEKSYAHLTSAMQGYLQGWYKDCDKQVVVDKNRAWLGSIEMLLHIEPNTKLIVCVRELGQIYGSIESQHQRSILIDFMDPLAGSDRFSRADRLFGTDQAIGAPLADLHAMPDLPKHVQECLYFVRFEDLMQHPVACMSHIFAWLGLSPFMINPDQLTTGIQESDSHYHMKFRHKQFSKIAAPQRHDIPPRIQMQIESAYSWFYQRYYPPQA